MQEFVANHPGVVTATGGAVLTVISWALLKIWGLMRENRTLRDDELKRNGDLLAGAIKDLEGTMHTALNRLTAMIEREALRKQQEEENAKLHRTIQDILKSHRAWADARLPVAIVGVLQALPTDPATSPGPLASGAASPGVSGLDQRGPADVGGIRP